MIRAKKSLAIVLQTTEIILIFLQNSCSFYKDHIIIKL